MENQSGTIVVSEKNQVATISFYHPASNSFPSSLLMNLASVISDFDHREDIHVLVLKSEGEKAFCAGASFDELLSIDNDEKGKAFFSGFAHVILAMRKSSKIIVGRVQGKTVGGGVGLAAACDYVFASKDASIKLSEIAIGIGPFVIEPAVTRKIGLPALAEMTLNPEQWKSAEWAKQHQLFNEVCENIEELDKLVENYTTRLASYNPMALYEMKKVLWQNTEHWEQLLFERAKISGSLVLSDFTKNALNKFKQQ